MNESGKTNLLLPLWKLSPAKDGSIVPLADYPRAEYTERKNGSPQVFVRAVFETNEAFKSDLAKITNLPAKNFDLVQFDRIYDGKFHVRFPSVVLPKTVQSGLIRGALESARSAIENDESDDVMKPTLLEAIARATTNLDQTGGDVSANQIAAVSQRLREVPHDPEDESDIAGLWGRLLDEINDIGRQLGLVHPDQIPEARERALRYKPAFVYYSNYGNLDSEIYLPHVIENLKREDLGSKEAAKARTLRVLFNFVGLEPDEILDLGRGLSQRAGRQPSEEEVAAAAEKSKERSVLLHSAGTKLTKAFREWWKQGEYRFRFEADGDHFRIWVTDDKRPEEVELEARSTGLQWFLSFFLVFLVESQEAHEGAILLLDEPGMSLHPLAQKDLRKFFDNLAATNQLLYTTHSPFLIDPDHLDQVRAVYIDQNGATAVSTDLRAGRASSPESKSVYAVHSALGLSVSDAILQGCTNVIVEGASDQLYLTAIKTILIGMGRIKPSRELLFLPGGGAKGVTAQVPIFTAKDDAPPHVILDSDAQGLQFAQKLRDGSIYAGEYSKRIRNVGELLTEVASAEVEDLMPREVMIGAAAKLFRGEEDFREVASSGGPIVPEIEQYARRSGLDLANGWKVDLARAVKQAVLKAPEKCSTDLLELWVELFEFLLENGNQRPDTKRRKEGTLSS